MEYIFSVTLVISALNALQLISIVVGNQISYPHWYHVSPTNWALFYPSVLFQCWFWSERLLFNS